MTFYDLMERHPRILNLLLGFTLVSLSFVAIFLASDIISSGSHAIHKNGVGELFIKIPKKTLEELKNWRTGTLADQIKTNGSNESNKTMGGGMVAGNVSPLGTAVSTNSSLDEPSVAFRQASSIIASVAASIAGSTNESQAPITRRHNSGGSQSKKGSVDASQLNDSQLNASQFNRSQLNASRLNESQLNEHMLNESKSDSSLSNEPHFDQPLPSESSPLNPSQLSQPQTNESELANRSQTVASYLTKTPIRDSLQNKSLQDISQPESSKANLSDSANKSQKEDSQTSQADAANQSQLSNPQSGIAEPMKESGSFESPPGQSIVMNKSEGKIGMLPQASATVKNDTGSILPAHDDGGKLLVDSSAGSSVVTQSSTGSLESGIMNSNAKANGAPSESAARESNPTTASAAPQKMPAGKTISGGSSEQSDLKTGSSSPSQDHSSGAVSSADVNKGSDKPTIKTLNFDSSQENDGSKVSPDSSGASSKAVSASKPSARIDNAKKDETTKQYRPIRAPRKPVTPRQARSLSRG